MYETICRNIYFPLLYRYKQIPYSQAFSEANSNQYVPIEKLQNITLNKLQNIIRHAEQNVLHYRESFRRAGLRANDLKSLQDFYSWPLLSKRDVFDSYHELRTSNFQGKSFTGITSGSTGAALRFEQDSEHHAWSDACYDRAHAWWGIEKGCRRLVLWSRPLVGGTRMQAEAWLKHRLQNGLSINTFAELTDKFLGQIAESFLRFKPQLIFGYGSSIGRLALFMDKQGIQVPKENNLKLIEYTADHLIESEKLVAQRVFGKRIGSLYSSSEASSLSYQCPKGQLHMSVDHIHVEFLREDGTAAEPDEPAEIIATQLNNRCMPLIRYRLGDIGSYSMKPCSCGVTLPVIKLEAGKLVEHITTSSRTFVSSYVIDFIVRYMTRNRMPGIRNFQIEQTALDDFTLHIVKSEPFEASTIEFLQDKMREHLGDSIQIKVNFVDDIQISRTGKRSWFVKSL